MIHNIRFKYLVVIIGDVYVYTYNKCNFGQPLLCLQLERFFIGRSKVCKMTEFSEPSYSSDFDGNTILLECGDNKYIYIFGLEIFEFKTIDKIMDYMSFMGNNMSPCTIVVGEEYTYFISNL